MKALNRSRYFKLGVDGILLTWHGWSRWSDLGWFTKPYSERQPLIIAGLGPQSVLNER